MELEWALSSMQPCRGEGGVISAAPLYDQKITKIKTKTKKEKYILL